MITRINDFIERAYTNSLEHGFHDEKTSFEHQMMLVISEISEASLRMMSRMSLPMFAFDCLTCAAILELSPIVAKKR